MRPDAASWHSTHGSSSSSLSLSSPSTLSPARLDSSRLSPFSLSLPGELLSDSRPGCEARESLSVLVPCSGPEGGCRGGREGEEVVDDDKEEEGAGGAGGIEGEEETRDAKLSADMLALWPGTTATGSGWESGESGNNDWLCFFRGEGSGSR